MHTTLKTFILILSLSFSVFARQANNSADRHMTLDVVVTDKSGKPVTGLQQPDFTIEDNKQPQSILSFQAVAAPAAEPPVEVILLMDRVNTSFQSSANERQQVEKFLRQNDGHLTRPISLVFFSDSGTQMETPSQDGNALVSAIDKSDASLRSIRRSQGVYGAVDRFQLSIRALNSVAQYELSRPGKKLLIWVSPGWPMLSGPRMSDISTKQRQQLFDEIVLAATALSRARITLYSVDPLGTADSGGLQTNLYREFIKGVAVEHKAAFGNLALQVLATQSGGRVLNSNNDIGSLIATSIDDANAFYVLSFETPRADGPNEYHALDVKVKNPALKVRTRTLYYAQP